MKTTIWILGAILIWGCGASSSTSGGAGSSDGASDEEAAQEVDPTATSDDVPFKDMAFGERKMFMKDVVMPGMKPLFAKGHPDFSCASCHGDNMADVNFEMPNTLAPLNPAAMPFESDDEKIRQAAAYMKDTIVPTMAGLLREEPFNPETKQGFGCFECHATAAQ
ncbi:MAG: hypothetical protein JXX29_21445 [Deltaproteobacteria bacterium]|nr:hypothetical protein [Deltaproteobacteria bacterium]MBN2674262.1 hypothetical protein [Deltaproteobacteria bacterium]